MRGNSYGVSIFSNVGVATDCAHCLIARFVAVRHFFGESLSNFVEVLEGLGLQIVRINTKVSDLIWKMTEQQVHVELFAVSQSVCPQVRNFFVQLCNQGSLFGFSCWGGGKLVDCWPKLGDVMAPEITISLYSFFARSTALWNGHHLSRPAFFHSFFQSKITTAASAPAKECLMILST
jgi:hypothetical protein